MRATTHNIVPSSEWSGCARRAAPIPRPGNAPAQRIWRRIARPRGLRPDVGRLDEQPGPGGPARNLQRPAHLQPERRGNYCEPHPTPYHFYLTCSTRVDDQHILFLHNFPLFLKLKLYPARPLRRPTQTIFSLIINQPTDTKYQEEPTPTRVQLLLPALGKLLGFRFVCF